MNEIKQVNAGKKVALVLAILSLVFTFLTILLAGLLDFLAFKDAIMQFIVALILPIPVFIVLFLAMVASFILIFGIYLVQQYGFWPLDGTIAFTKEILGGITITPEQIQLFKTFRLIILLICVVLLAMAVVSRVLAYEKKEKVVIDGKPVKKKIQGSEVVSTIAIVFIAIGIIVSIAAMIISSNIIK